MPRTTIDLTEDLPTETIDLTDDIISVPYFPTEYYSNPYVEIDLTGQEEVEINDMATLEDMQTMFQEAPEDDQYEYIQVDAQYSPPRLPILRTSFSPPRLERVLTMRQETPQTPIRERENNDVVPETPRHLWPRVDLYDTSRIFHDLYFNDRDALFEFPRRQNGEPLICEDCGTIFIYRGLDEERCFECAVNYDRDQN